MDRFTSLTYSPDGAWNKLRRQVPLSWFYKSMVVHLELQDLNSLLFCIMQSVDCWRDFRALAAPLVFAYTVLSELFCVWLMPICPYCVWLLVLSNRGNICFQLLGCYTLLFVAFECFSSLCILSCLQVYFLMSFWSLSRSVWKNFFIDECAMCLVVIDNLIPVAFFVLCVCIGFFIFWSASYLLK